MLTDPEGYVLFKTNQVDNRGGVTYQHKEAIHCAKSAHYFRGMYGSADVLDNRDNADVRWADWKTNSREAWNIDRLYAIKTFVCANANR